MTPRFRDSPIPDSAYTPRSGFWISGDPGFKDLRIYGFKEFDWREGFNSEVLKSVNPYLFDSGIRRSGILHPRHDPDFGFPGIPDLRIYGFKDLRKLIGGMA